MIIYLITNKINDKRYVGLTTQTMEERWKQHKYDALHGNNYPIHKAMRKYGIENFRIEIIDTATSIEELKRKEQYWIDKLDTYGKEYNATIGGDSSTRKTIGYTKINLRTGKIEAQYKSAKECNQALGGSTTQNADKITQTQYKDYVVVKTKNLEGKTNQEIKDYAFSLRPKIICQLKINDNGKVELVGRWINSSDAILHNPNITKSCLFDCLKNRRQTHLGYKWKYYKDIEWEE